MKKIFALLTVFIMLLCMASCKKENEVSSKKSSSLKIGVIQYMSHPSLDNCYKGIKEAIEESGIDYNITLQTGASNSADSDCVSFARNMVADGCDMIIAIATPAAKAAFAATEDTDIPVVFCAVSDPIEAKLVKSLEAPGYNCSGTSDVLDLAAQVNLIKSMQPDVKSIGVLYTSSEDNSISNLRTFKEVCEKAGITVEGRAVQNASDIPSAAEELASKVDCINNFTDNNIVTNLNVVLSAADKHGIPVYGSEIEQVKNGCLAAVSIEYVALGRATGEMAVKALNGDSLSEMPVKSISDAVPVINKAALEKLKMTMPEQYKDAEIV